ncbi:RhoGEF domain-containing protein gxcJ [Leucoagaricus sp. SymC.cos]|nr:RhoGEF domain-containing protein gxcJ [Leucoagaricus sp. SymC.cos]
MKAFFTRLHIGGSKDKDSSKSTKPWPPPEQPRPPTSPASFTAFKPLPELVHSSFASQLSPRSPPPLEPTPSTSSHHSTAPSNLPPSAVFTPPPRSAELPHAPLVVTNVTPTPTPPEPESPEQISRKATVASNGTTSSTTTTTNNTASDVQKKVAFISPPPTPGPPIFERDLPETPPFESPPAPAPMKTNVSRFQATHGEKPRTPVAAAASSSKVDVSSRTAVKATNTRATSPYFQKDVVSAQSLRSATPYSTMSGQASGSRILAAASWSELTEEDLVSNLGSRERTRQEVLFEIISSEERYVQELIKMKETFVDPLLHPFSATPSLPSVSSPSPAIDYDYYRTETPGGAAESTEDLPPIAARFMSPTPSLGQPSGSSSARKNTETPNIDDSLTEDEDDDTHRPYSSKRSATSHEASKHNHPRSPYRSTATRTSTKTGTTVPFPSRSHHSLPHPIRSQAAASTQSLGKQSTIVDRERERKRSETTPQKSGVLRKFRKSETPATSILGDLAIPPHQLPEDLRICLEVIDGGVFDGHKRLSEALKRRYDDQYPLVRSLADVFVSNSDIFHGYATYVLHLERALEQVDATLANTTNKKPKKQDAGDWQKVCKVFRHLEELAAEKGETGLAITLSKPFQRLLKYPLLFQNLLYHTDPSTYEYESTLLMVAEVENIVRSIEDEKIQKEERDKTRDVFARIEGLDKVRQVALPKPSRVLVEERPCNPGGSPLSGSRVTSSSSPPPAINAKGVRGKSSFKRLSDVLGSSGIGGKKDLWYVVFNDVVLQCQRTGTTSLPIAHTTTNRVNSLPDMGGKSKYASTGRRNSYTKPRNLYKFIKIETWTIGDVVQPREGVVSMEDVVRSRHQSVNQQPRIVPLPDDDDDDNDSDDSDRKSKMSFSYWGADKITVQKPVVKGRPGVAARRTVQHASYGRESSANAKFGTRLVSRRPGIPTSSEDTPNYAKATITRSAWDSSTKTVSPSTINTHPGGTNNLARKRNTSQISTKATITPASSVLPPQKIASPVPSEDSGVGLGLYQKVLANDPTLSNA